MENQKKTQGMESLDAMLEMLESEADANPQDEPETDTAFPDFEEMQESDTEESTTVEEATEAPAPEKDTSEKEEKLQNVEASQAEPLPSQEPINPFQQALEKAQQREGEQLLSAARLRKPVFKFAGSEDVIENPDITFEALREKYEQDFPELSDAKRVSWEVQYGKSPTKAIIGAAKQNVSEVKKEIESSKAFADALSKAMRSW